jgi:hypothetical protein
VLLEGEEAPSLSALHAQVKSIPILLLIIRTVSLHAEMKVTVLAVRAVFKFDVRGGCLPPVPTL